MKANSFIPMMNMKQSAPIQQNLTHFILDEFPNHEHEPTQSISKLIQSKISELVIQFSKIWNIDVEKNEEDYNILCNSFENAILKKLYNKIFSKSSEEKSADFLFECQIKKFSFIKPKHLEIDDSLLNKIYIDTAINKLSMINLYKAPKDKISTIINFCNILTTMLINSNNKELKPKEDNPSINNDDVNMPKAAGADEMMPIIVYCLIQGNIRKLKSNLNYIRNFRHHTMFDSNKEEYFTTVIQSAVEFIDNLNENSDLNEEREVLKQLIEEQEQKILHEEYSEPLPERNKNADENYLVYYLTNDSNNKNNNNKDSANSNSEQSSSELFDYKKNISGLNINTGVLKNSLLNKKEGIKEIDFDKLYKEYFNKELKDMPIGQIEKMVNDFKLLLVLLNKPNK